MGLLFDLTSKRDGVKTRIFLSLAVTSAPLPLASSQGAPLPGAACNSRYFRDNINVSAMPIDQYTQYGFLLPMHNSTRILLIQSRWVAIRIITTTAEGVKSSDLRIGLQPGGVGDDRSFCSPARNAVVVWRQQLLILNIRKNRHSTERLLLCFDVTTIVLF